MRRTLRFMASLTLFIAACGGGDPTNPPAGDGGTADQMAGDMIADSTGDRPPTTAEHLTARVEFEGQNYDFCFSTDRDFCPPPPAGRPAVEETVGCTFESSSMELYGHRIARLDGAPSVRYGRIEIEVLGFQGAGRYPMAGLKVWDEPERSQNRWGLSGAEGGEVVIEEVVPGALRFTFRVERLCLKNPDETSGRPGSCIPGHPLGRFEGQGACAQR